jgi:hypothetical protein
MLFTQFRFSCMVSEEIETENEVNRFSAFNVLSFNFVI